MRRLCAFAGVSRGGYYKYLHHDSKKEVEDKEIADIILFIQEEHHYSIGYRKMPVMLMKRGSGKKYGPKRIHRVMKENNLQSAVRIKKYSDEVYIRRRKMMEELPKDLIKRNFFAMEPQIRLIEDITYLPCMEQTMYLNAIEDLFNGEILAYMISDSVDAKLCTDTVKRLAEKLEKTDGVILHSDGGSTYIAYSYKELVETQLHMRRSMGKTRDCFDNAPIESLNGIIKTECLYCRFGKSRVNNHMISMAAIIPAVTDFIGFYNTFRPKEGLGWLSPVEFRLKNPKGVYPAIIKS